MSVTCRGPDASRSGDNELVPLRGDHDFSSSRYLGEDMADVSDAHDQRYGDLDIGETPGHRGHDQLLAVMFGRGEVLEFTRQSDGDGLGRGSHLCDSVAEGLVLRALATLIELHGHKTHDVEFVGEKISTRQERL